MQARLIAPPVHDYLQYQYRADLGVLVGRWLRQPTDDELHTGYYHLLDVAEANGARLWLLDARRRDHANQHGTPWMVETFFPLLAQRLSGAVHLAFLFMPAHLQEIEQDAKVPPLSYFDGLPYKVMRFVEEQPAMNWLENCRRNPPA